MCRFVNIVGSSTSAEEAELHKFSINDGQLFIVQNTPKTKIKQNHFHGEIVLGKKCYDSVDPI